MEEEKIELFIAQIEVRKVFEHQLKHETVYTKNEGVMKVHLVEAKNEVEAIAKLKFFYADKGQIGKFKFEVTILDTEPVIR